MVTRPPGTRRGAQRGWSARRVRSQGCADALRDRLTRVLEIGPVVEPLVELGRFGDPVVAAAGCKAGLGPVASRRRAVARQAGVVVRPVEVDEQKPRIGWLVRTLELRVETVRPAQRNPRQEP